MDKAVTIIRKQPWDVDVRLHGLSLTRPGLLKVRAMARSASADATAFHPINAPGTLGYQHGTFGLRDVFIGKNWVMARPEGVETIFNAKANAMVAFANVDVACNDFAAPKPRSRKGAGAERVAQGNLFGMLPQYAPRQQGGVTMFYFLVDEKGAAELSVPVVENGTFISFIERNFLTDSSDLDDIVRSLDNGDVANDFDPQVIRKRG